MLNLATQAAALWRIRKHSRSRRFISRLTPWSPGLAVSEGDYVQSFDNAYRAASGGVTGATPPNNISGNTMSDGAVTWGHVAYLLTAQPTI